MLTREQKRLNAVQRPEAYREVLIDSAGLPVALSVWEGEPAMPSVLFLPGTMTHPLFYEEFLDALNRAGHTVVGVHLAGHGKSPRLRAHRLTFDDLVRSAVDAFAWLRREHPDAPAAVLGSSQGGVLALAVAAQPTGAAAVFAHNVLDPALPDTVTVTRVPTWLTPAYPRLRPIIGALGRLAPGVPVPFGAYLDISRVSRDPDVVDRFYTDPLGLRTYPLGLLAGMLTTDLPGPAQCPIVVIAATEDPLFSLAYTRQVFARIDAPSKELLVVHSDQHLLFTDALDVAVPAVLELLGSLPAGAERRGPAPESHGEEPSSANQSARPSTEAHPSYNTSMD
jgi:alpha-beta hydrolase superfamily lysophospholipase